MSSIRRKNPSSLGDYLRVAPFYDRLATTYSLGAIDRSRRVHLAYLRSNSKVLYAGAGTGQEAMGAAELGHDVALWDPSAAMLERAAQRRARLPPSAQARVQLHQAPLQALPAQERFDAIVCNYFLNVFAPEDIPWWLNRLKTHLLPGGSLWIADFSPLGGILKPLAWLYHTAPLLCFHYWTGNAKHNPYDYAHELPRAGWTLTRIQPVGLTAWGPPWFTCWQSQLPSDA